MEQAGPAHVAAGAWAEPEPVPHTWRQGPWSVTVQGADLSDVSYAGQRVLLGVRAVVRDAVWNTVPALVSSRSETEEELVLRLRFSGFGAELDGELALTASSGGDAGHLEDTLAVRLDLRARGDFDRARVGLVVLHPAALAGVALEVTSPVGATTRTAFPRAVAPHQPAVEISGLSWRTDSVACSLRLDGDTFEMEDQRNWTDASFKTYSTPLALPYPVRIHAGEHVRQSMMLSCRSLPPSDAVPRPGRASGRPVGVRLVDTGRLVPAVGLGVSTAPGAVPTVVAPGAAHLMVELDAAGPTWSAALSRALQEADRRPLDVKVVVDEADQVWPVVRVLDPHRLVRLTTHSARTQVTEPALWAALLSAADRVGIATHVLYGGARSDFTELNRHHGRLPSQLPALCFSMTPQVHASDRRQLVASIGMQRLVTSQAVRIAAGRPVHVGPVTLRPRYNPSVTVRPTSPADLSEGYGAHLVPSATDPRQASPAAAAWLLASAAAVAAGGAASITYAETWGPRGVVDSDGTPFPVASAFDMLVGIQGRALLVPECDDGPDDVWVLGARSGTGVTVLAANLTARALTVQAEVGSGSVRLDLGPFGTGRGELGGVVR